MALPPMDSGYATRLRHGYRIGRDTAVRRYSDLRATTWGRAIIDRAQVVFGLVQDELGRVGRRSLVVPAHG